MKKIRTAPYIPTEFEIEEIGDDRALISIAPFEAGYAITLAHPLKRLILSSTVGYAPTAIKIDGASHEFDSIRGVSEDVARLIINLKNIRFKIDGDKERVVVDYSFKGYKEVTGLDFENDDILVSTPDTHFATVNEDGELSFSLVIEKGMGYVPSEEIREETNDSFLPLDAIFTPVKKANYSIEKVLVEDSNDFEKITFEIVTDGQVSPSRVFQDAVATMFKQLEIFTTEFGIKNSVAPVKIKEEDVRLKTLLTKIEDLNLSARSHNCLTRNSIKFIGEVVMMSESELSKVKNLGKKSLDEIKDKLVEIGYPITDDLDAETFKSLKEKIAELKG